jgi:hypothetical protein
MYYVLRQKIYVARALYVLVFAVIMGEKMNDIVAQARTAHKHKLA